MNVTLTAALHSNTFAECHLLNDFSSWWTRYICTSSSSSSSISWRERRLTFAGHCYRCEDQPVKHLVLWEGPAGKMVRGQGNRMTYVKQLLRDSCCETVDDLQRKMKNRMEWAKILHTTTSSSEWLRSLRRWMDGLVENDSTGNSSCRSSDPVRAPGHNVPSKRCRCWCYIDRCLTCLLFCLPSLKLGLLCFQATCRVS